MTYSDAKVQGQWSVGSEDKVETNGRMDVGDCITSHANVVGKNSVAMAASQKYNSREVC